MDYTFIHGITHLHSVSIGCTFRTVEYIPGNKPTKKHSVKGTRKIINVFKKHGIRISQINADNAFECICEKIQPTNLNIVGAGEHVGDIERANRPLKEETRCEIHRCPYRRYTHETVKGCVIKVTKDHNDLSANDGISDIHGPGILVTVRQKPGYNRLNVLNFGDYV